jgi:hypothetical protein
VGRKGVGVIKRVHPEVEELVRAVGERLGYTPYSIRNAALVYGLLVIALTKRVPEDDREFFGLVEVVRMLLSRWLDGEGSQG